MRMPSAGAGDVQNQNAHADKPIRNAQPFIAVPSRDPARFLSQRLIPNGGLGFRQRLAAISTVVFALVTDGLAHCRRACQQIRLQPFKPSVINAGCLNETRGNMTAGAIRGRDILTATRRPTSYRYA